MLFSKRVIILSEVTAITYRIV